MYLTSGYTVKQSTLVSITIDRQVIRRLRMSNEAVYDRQCAHEVMRMT